jgi:hypothetical protein
LANGQGFEKDLVTLKPEAKFWQEWKKFTPNILWTRIENSSSLGTPDLLGYNKNNVFFTVELKVTVSNAVRLSPHQMSFHIRHPKNSFILIKSLAPRHSKLGDKKLDVRLYTGNQVLELAACGLKLAPCCLGLEACRLHLEQLGA